MVSLVILMLVNFNLVYSQEKYPVYVTGEVPLHEYTLFANTGWDGNWYIGYNMCWIKMFSKEYLPDKNDIERIYVGVKIGRAKTVPKPSAPPWEKEIIDGNIYVGVSSTCAWKSNQRYFLCKVKDIPTEGDWENAITTTGESRWFFTEIPMDRFDFNNDVWVCVYSNSPELISASSAPILAGGWRDRKSKKDFVWLNNEISGSPPINPDTALKTPIRAFEPAIILKFIPKNVYTKPEIEIVKILDGRPSLNEKVFYINYLSANIERVWMEISVDKDYWERVSKYIYTTPYVLSLTTDMIQEKISGDFYLRFAAADIFENIGYSEELILNISREDKKTEKSVKERNKN